MDIDDILAVVDGDNPPTDNFMLNRVLKDLIMIIDNQQKQIDGLNKQISALDTRTAGLIKIGSSGGAFGKQ